MQITGNLQTYDPRAASSAAANRVMMAPYYMPISHHQAGSTSEGMVSSQTNSGQHSHQHQHQQHQHQMPFQFMPLSNTSPQQLGPAFTPSFVPQRSSPAYTQAQMNVPRPMQHREYPRTTFLEAQQNHSPVTKTEAQWSPLGQSPSYTYGARKVSPSVSVQSIANDAIGKTDIDNLVKVIQVKSDSQTKPIVGQTEGVSLAHSSEPALRQAQVSAPGASAKTHHDVDDSNKDAAKRHRCDKCEKRFSQKTHLDIHKRSHTGDKPYVRHTLREDI